MRRIAGLMFLLVLQGPLQAATVPKDIIASLSRDSVLRTWRIVAALPLGLKHSLEALFKESSLEIADPNTALSDTFEIEGNEKPPPDKRLIFAFETSSFYVVYVEYGPPAVHYAVLIFRRDRLSSPKFVWGGTDLRPVQPVTSPSKLINSLSKGRFTYERGVIW